MPAERDDLNRAALARLAAMRHESADTEGAAMRTIRARLEPAARSLGIDPTRRAASELRRAEALVLQLESWERAAVGVFGLALDRPDLQPSAAQLAELIAGAPAKARAPMKAARDSLRLLRLCRESIRSGDAVLAALAAIEGQQAQAAAEWGAAHLFRERARASAGGRALQAKRAARETTAVTVARLADRERARAEERGETLSRKKLAEVIATKHLRGKVSVEYVRRLIPSERAPVFRWLGADLSRLRPSKRARVALLRWRDEGEGESD